VKIQQRLIEVVVTEKDAQESDGQEMTDILDALDERDQHRGILKQGPAQVNMPPSSAVVRHQAF